MAFEDWVRQVNTTGNISPVRLGWSRRQLRELFGEPTDVGLARFEGKPMILRYSDTEFHFGPEGLFLIYREDPLTIPQLVIQRVVTG